MVGTTGLEPATYRVKVGIARLFRELERGRWVTLGFEVGVPNSVLKLPNEVTLRRVWCVSVGVSD
jgi:hypothetical protein